MSGPKHLTGGEPAAGRGFHLDRANGKVMGVCGGIADYAGIDPTLVRVGFVLGAFVSFGTAALIYLAIGLIAD
jgi:phage shock protein PspC (stress-responsive transcriptional regulator)